MTLWSTVVRTVIAFLRPGLAALVILGVAVLEPPAAFAAAIVVTTLDDGMNSDGDCSLREAITAADTNVPVDGCPAGSASSMDTITFAVGGTIALGAALPDIADPAGVTIDGSGAIAITGGAGRIVRVLPCARLDLHGLVVTETVGDAVLNDGHLSVVDTVFRGTKGNAINTTGPTNVSGSLFASNGRGISANRATVRILSSAFTDNQDAFYGASALWVTFSTVTIARSTFTDNRGGERGAMLLYGSTATITDSTFRNNRAYRQDIDARGGAIESSGTTLVVAGSTFVDNYALYVGLNGAHARGGALHVDHGAVTVSNSTFVANLALAYNYNGFSRAFGGAIQTRGGSGTVDLVNSTFADNQARSHSGSSEPRPDLSAGGTIHREGLTVTLRNTLVAKALDGTWDAVPACFGALVDGGGNLSSDGTCPGLHADPLLDPAGLEDNGGPTETIALQPGSPAIAAGVGATCAAAPVNGVDQRAALRLSCDVGAFAYASAAPPVSAPDALPPLPAQSGCPVFNQPPVVTNPGDQTSAEGGAPSLQIGASDPDGDAIGYAAVGLPPGLAIDAATGLVTGMLGYDAAGSYGVTITVTDARGASSSVSFTWAVTDVNRPPAVTNPGSQTSAEGTSPSLQISASDLDADALTYSATGLPPGLGIDAATGRIAGTLGYSAAGTYAVTVSVSDGSGGSASVSFTWTVADINRAPIARADSATTVEDTPVTVNVLANDDDPDGDALTVLGVAQPSRGTTLLNADGTVTYVPASNFNGSDGFSYTIRDALGATATATVTLQVTPVNDPPTLAPIADQTHTVGQAVTLDVVAADADGDGLSFTATDLPAGITVNPATGTMSGVLQAPGAHQATVIVSDGNGGRASASFRWSAVTANRPPVCTATASPSVIWPPNHKQKVVVRLVGVADPDGDPVSVTMTGILQDEPTNTLGDGETWIDGGGVGTSEAWVRAERSGTPRVPGNGRVYEILYRAEDGHGGSCTGSALVGVPHDQGKGPAIDDGIRYDSTVAGGPRAVRPTR